MAALPLLYRLRRSVALIICPEMGVEARLKAAREQKRLLETGADDFQLPTASVDRWETIVARALAASDVFAELDGLVEVLRRENARLGQDDRDFGLLLCAALGQVAVSMASQGEASK